MQRQHRACGPRAGPPTALVGLVGRRGGGGLLAAEGGDTQLDLESQGGTGGEPWANVVTVELWRAPSGTALVVARAAVRDDCGGFSGSLATVFDLRESALTLRPEGGTGGFDPVAVFDADGDGAPEILAEPSGLNDTTMVLIRLQDGTYKRVEELSYPNLDCPC